MKETDMANSLLENCRKSLALAGAVGVLAGAAVTSRSQTSALGPVDYINPLIGTAPMMDKEHLGNNPAPNEDLYYGSVNPGAKVPDPNGNLALGPVSGFD